MQSWEGGSQGRKSWAERGSSGQCLWAGEGDMRYLGARW